MQIAKPFYITKVQLVDIGRILIRSLVLDIDTIVQRIIREKIAKNMKPLNRLSIEVFRHIEFNTVLKFIENYYSYIDAVLNFYFIMF